MNIELEIDGVPDSVIAGANRKRVRTLGQHLNRSGTWRVMLGPSEVRGESDLRIREDGMARRLVCGACEQLPDIVERTLRERLVLLVSDASPAR